MTDAELITTCRAFRGGLLGEGKSGIEYSWRSPVTMPRRASRTTLRVESVTVKRVQEITEEEAKWVDPNGWEPECCRDHRIGLAAAIRELVTK